MENKILTSGEIKLLSLEERKKYQSFLKDLNSKTEKTLLEVIESLKSKSDCDQFVYHLDITGISRFSFYLDGGWRTVRIEFKKLFFKKTEDVVRQIIQGLSNSSSYNFYM